MATRENRYTFTDQRPTQIENLDDSRFWRRLDELSQGKHSKDRKEAIEHLKVSVRKITARSEWISTQICRFMPQYTLHEGRHFLNVLAIMDALVPDTAIARFGALDCALPILAAYTHDLGMALSQEEYDKIHDQSTEQGKHFASFRTRFGDELRQLDQWKKRGAEPLNEMDSESHHEAAALRKRIASIEGFILATYLRDTHTEDTQIRRLRRWLDAIKRDTGDDNLFRFGVGGKDYQREISLIGISHGRSASWLRRQLVDGGPDDRFFQPLAGTESTNLAFPGLLLRLADVMDFDASRAPRILFKHFGIENDRSILEWNKHLAIVGWRLEVEPDDKQQPELLYSAECEHPVHEKTIREFATWIDAELSAVRAELDAQRRQLPRPAQMRYDLHLPSQTRLDIRSVRDPLTDQPKYIFRDLQFRLDQDEIQQLLMGDSLYGDPSLCIRELLQNALDALELRELRLRMKQKGGPREPVDGDLTRPGWLRDLTGSEEQLQVTLDWGIDKESGQQWLRVNDNGVGMTENIIMVYLTQIGKSYYRSPEFNQERAVMKAAGEVVSPISTFGIGFLSCFMLADHVHVRTHPGQVNASDRAPRDIIISGPGSLFWLKHGTRCHQGTDITVYLKRRFSIAHDSQLCLQHLREYFGYDRVQKGKKRRRAPDKDQTTVINPAYIAAQHVVWPRYPIAIEPAGEPAFIVDEAFHTKTIGRIDYVSVVRKAEDWECPPTMLGKPTWVIWEWRDDAGHDATGSRVRLWIARHQEISDRKLIFADHQSESLCFVNELAALVEPQLEVDNRVRILVRGMNVQDVGVAANLPHIKSGLGTRVWVDLCGDAAPQLTTDRQRLNAGKDDESWFQAVGAVFARMGEALLRDVRDVSTVSNLMSCFVLSKRLGSAMQRQVAFVAKEFRMVAACSTSWHAPDPLLQLEFCGRRQSK